MNNFINKYLLQYFRIISFLLLLILPILLGFSGCNGCSKSGLRKSLNESKTKPTSQKLNRHAYGSNTIRMEKQNGVYMIPVEINGVPMHFIFDTGASLISISSTEAIFLYKQGKLSSEDILGKSNFVDANGYVSEGTIIVLREVRIGNKLLINVKASVVNNLEAPILMGQSALEKFGKISIDYEKNEITFE